MATHDVKHVKTNALVLANDLRSGLTVYLDQNNQWTTQVTEALHITSDEAAADAMAIAGDAERANVVIGAYLVDATAQGVPTHIREILRVDGPSIDYLQNQSSSSVI